MPGVATRDLYLNVHEKRDGDALAAAARDMEKLGHEGEVTASKFTKSSNTMRANSQTLDSEIHKVELRIRELGDEFARTGDRTVLRQLRSNRSMLAEFRKIENELTADAELAGKEVGKSLSSGVQGGLSTPGLGPILVGSLVAGAVAASPAIGAALSGAIVGTGAGLGIAGGIIAAAHDERVQEAWKNFADELTPQAFGSDFFAGPVVAGISKLRDTFEGLHLDQVLGQAAPAVDELADGISRFVTNLMPGFNSLMADAESITGVFADGLADTGSALSEFVTDLLTSKGTLEGLHFLFMLVNGTIRSTGEALHFLGDAFHDMIVFGAKASGVLEDIEKPIFNIMSLGTSNGPGWFAAWNDKFEEMAKTAPLMASGMTGAADAVHHFTAAANLAVGATGDLAGALTEAQQGFFAFVGADVSAEGALDDLTQNIKEHGRSLDSDTEAGRANLSALNQFAQGAIAAAKAKYDETGSLKEAQEAYNGYRDQLKQTLISLGYTADAAQTLIDKWLGLNNLPDIFKQVHINYIRTGGSQTAAYESGVDNIYLKGFAAGGPVQRGVPILVGEMGPELFTPRSNGYIVPNPSQTSGMSGGSGVTISFAATGDSFLDAMVRELRRYIRVHGGGNVQVALGN